MSISGAANETAIKDAIEAKLADYDIDKETITLTDETIATANFKKIEISYDHDLLINLSSYFSGMTLPATRYAPATG